MHILDCVPDVDVVTIRKPDPSCKVVQVASAAVDGPGVRLDLQPTKGSGDSETMHADIVLVSTGRLCSNRVFVATS